MEMNSIEKVLSKASAFIGQNEISRLRSLFLEEASQERKAEKSPEDLLEAFLTAKKVEGCSSRTTKYYKYVIEAFLKGMEKAIFDITTDDIRSYINGMFDRGHISNVSADNTRRILSSFFAWLTEEDYLQRNPMKRIHKIKAMKPVREGYSDEMIETIKTACTSLRDLTIVELLCSTGMRVGELVRINRSDVDFERREIVVLGKGNKQRKVYFDAKTKLHLNSYLSSRIDDNEALFVSLYSPNSRLQISGVEIVLRKIGQKTNLSKVHPHRFRRTLATKAIDKGMPVEQVQILLGHAKIDTTLHYAIVDQNNVRNSYHRYLE